MFGTEQVQRAVLFTTDFEELQEASSDWDQQYFQMDAGQFEGRLELTQVGSRQIFREFWGKKLRYQGTTPAGSFAFALRLDQGEDANWVGQCSNADSVIFQPPGQEAEFVSSGGWDALVLSISEDELSSTLMALTGGEDMRNALCGVLPLPPQAAHKLRFHGYGFLERSRRNCHADEPGLVKASEQFARMFLWEVVQALAPPTLTVDPCKSSKIVSQATDMVLNENSGAVGLLEICNELKVSLRTLHYSFQDITGMSPATWLRRVRLNQVYKALNKASPDEIMVKQVALDNGFFHGGHFSKQYLKHFGCLPSETLQAT